MLKKIVFTFAVLVISFILSATLLGQYHSAPSVIIGACAGLGYAWLIDKNYINFD